MTSEPRISLITPTCDRPRGVELCERYMARQTVHPHEWIVADGGDVPATLTMGQVHVHERTPRGPRNLAANVLRALDHVTGDIIVMIEDDDWYAPDHIEACIEGLQSAPMYGCPTLKYYNIPRRCWVVMKNRGSALCQTAFRREMIPAMKRAALGAYRACHCGIDTRFWGGREATGRGTVIGIKGIAGAKGLGIGHHPNSRWRPDPRMDKLRDWIGDDADNYREAA